MIRGPQNQLEWQAYYDLRYKILREPWGQPKGSEQTPDESEHQHFAYFDSLGNIQGVGRLDKSDANTFQIRFMAVNDAVQRNGIGSELIEEMQHVAEHEGAEKIILHARENAIHFYQKLGYQMLEKSHLLFGQIQHYLMIKNF